MDERIEAFLRDVLALEGEHSNLVREGVRVLLANYERHFRNAGRPKSLVTPALHHYLPLDGSRAVTWDILHTTGLVYVGV